MIPPSLALALALSTLLPAPGDPPDLPLASTPTGGVDILPGISVGDLDGDGRLDVAYATGISQGVAYHRGDGFGGFGPRIDASMHTTTLTGTVLFDADLDGDLDVGAGTVGTAFRRLLNDGQGGLAQTLILPAPIAINRAPQAADMDLDGDDDVVISSVNGFLILINDGAGGLTFGAPIQPSSAVAGRFRIGDVDGDGDPDVVSVFNSVVDVLAGDGQGGLGPVFSLPMQSTGPIDLALGDLDGDQDLDLVVASVTGNGTGVERLLNPGSGAFGVGNPSMFLGSLDLGSAIALTDLNRNGSLDVVALHQNGFVLSALMDPGAGPPQAVVQRPTSGYGRALAVASLDGDAIPDVVIGCGLGSASHLVVARGDGAALGGGETLDVGTSASLLAVRDADGDGDRDAIVVAGSAGELRLYLNDGLGHFTPGPTLQLGHPVGPAVARDLDGDGWLDVVAGSKNGATPVPASVTVARGVPGGFQIVGSVGLASLPSAITVGRFNADAALDVAVLRRIGTSPPAVDLVLAVGGGFVLAGSQAFDAVNDTLCAIDVDHDGLDDLATARLGAGVNLFLNQGGAFVPAGFVALPATAVSLARMNADGDAFADLGVLTNPAAGGAFVLRGTATGALIPGAPAVTAAPIPQGLAAVDVDGDGLDDLAAWAGAQYGVASWVRSIGNGDLEPGRAFATPHDVTAATFADVDGDGHADLVSSRGFDGLSTASPEGDLYVAVAACAGGTGTYGAGCGAGATAPRLTVTGCLEVGQSVEIRVDQAPALTTGFLLLGLGGGSVPLGNGCELLVAPVLPALVPIGAGPAGVGQLAATLVAAASAQTFTAQVAFPGPAFALTNGLELRVD